MYIRIISKHQKFVDERSFVVLVLLSCIEFTRYFESFPENL